MDYKSFAIGVFVALLYRLITYLIFAFFDGWDNKTGYKSKLYLFVWTLGNKLYIKKLIKESMQVKNDENNQDNL